MKFCTGYKQDGPECNQKWLHAVMQDHTANNIFRCFFAIYRTVLCITQNGYMQDSPALGHVNFMGP